MTKGYTYQSALYIFEALAIFIQSSCQVIYIYVFIQKN